MSGPSEAEKAVRAQLASVYRFPVALEDRAVEERALGWMMLCPAAMEVAATTFGRSPFRVREHRRVYEVAVRVWESGETVDALSLVDAGADRELVHSLAALVPCGDDGFAAIEKVARRSMKGEV